MKTYNYKNIILRHNKSIVKSRSLCDITAKFGDYTFATPVLCANMDSLLTPEICKQFDDNGWFYVYPRIKGEGDVLRFVEYAQKFNVVSISIGLTRDWVSFIESLCHLKMRVDFFTVDVALSHTDNIKPILKHLKIFYPESMVICGNGSTKEWVKWALSDPDIYGRIDCLKVGIGVSSSCRTRQFTGFGSTTVSSLLECVEEADHKVKIMSDGGLTVTDGVVWIGDIAKALVLGADFVMSGVLFSRCIDSPSLVEGYYGNASARAKSHHNHVEGATVKVESNGMTILQMMRLVEDSLRSSVSYSGGATIADMKRVTVYDYVAD